MSSLGTSKGILEIAKFGLYVTIPIVLMYTFANNRENLQKFMGNVKSLPFSFYVYGIPEFMSNLLEMAVDYWRKDGEIALLSCEI